MIGYEILLYLGSSLFSLYSLRLILSAFFHEREFNNDWVKIIIQILFVISLTIETVIIPPGYIIIIINLLLSLALSYLYMGKFCIKLSIAIIWLLLGIIIEVFVVYLIGILFNISAVEFQQNLLTKTIGSLIINLVLMIIAIIFKRKTKKSIENKNLLFSSMHIIVIPIISIIIFTCLFYLTINISGIIQSFVTIILIGIIVINIFTFYFIEQANANRELRFQNEILTAKTNFYLENEKNLLSSTEQTRKLKHDLKYKFLYIKDKLDENSNDALHEISNYINDVIGNISNESYIVYTKSTNINKLINYKLKEAEQKNIKTKVNILVSEDIKLNTDVLYIVLGNVLDNAIEHYDDSECELKRIDIAVIEDRGNLLIDIKNPYSKKIQVIDDLPITTKQDLNNHGLGLQNVRRIVQEENGIFNWYAKDNIFTVELLLFKK